MSINEPSVVHESKLDSLKECCRKFWDATTIKFMIWSGWNIIRYIIVGILIFYANHRNVSDINDYRSYCCDCLFISQQSKDYGISDDTRFDLSYVLSSIHIL